jgi:hypothetical protein
MLPRIRTTNRRQPRIADTSREQDTASLPIWSSVSQNNPAELKRAFDIIDGVEFLDFVVQKKVLCCRISSTRFCFLLRNFHDPALRDCFLSMGNFGMTIQQMDSRRLGPNAGIAIGAILFMVAILAILAAAVAAGSGSFTSSTTNDSSRTKSSALVSIGDNLNTGMEHITAEGGILPLSVVLDPTQTSGVTDLFSPSGGGIAAPSVSMANNPVYDVWYYPTGYVKGIGTGSGGSYDILAVLPVSPGVCAEINNRTQGQALTPATAALGDFTSATAGAVTVVLFGRTLALRQGASKRAAPPSAPAAALPLEQARVDAR